MIKLDIDHRFTAIDGNHRVQALMALRDHFRRLHLAYVWINSDLRTGKSQWSGALLQRETLSDPHVIAIDDHAGDTVRHTPPANGPEDSWTDQLIRLISDCTPHGNTRRKLAYLLRDRRRLRHQRSYLVRQLATFAQLVRIHWPAVASIAYAVLKFLGVMVLLLGIWTAMAVTASRCVEQSIKNTLRELRRILKHLHQPDGVAWLGESLYAAS